MEEVKLATLQDRPKTASAEDTDHFVDLLLPWARPRSPKFPELRKALLGSPELSRIPQGLPKLLKYPDGAPSPSPEGSAQY